MAEITQLCHRLEVWLTENFPAVLTSFNSGATDQEIAKYENVTGLELPEDVCGWYRWRNGQKRWPKESILFGDELLSLADSLQEWKNWQDVADLNAEVAPHCSSKPEGAILAAYSLPGWIPMAQSPGNSNYLGIDLNPGPTGSAGQVIFFGRDVEAKCVLGSTFSDFLEFFVEEMESGRISVGVPSGTRKGDLPWTLHSLCGSDRHFESLPHQLHDLGKFDGRRLHIDESIKLA